jgi:glycosyltransferase involved in cell wall biosynthesis
MSMHIVLVDPFLYTLPYNKALASGLIANGHKITAFGRPLKAGEQWDLEGSEYVELPAEDRSVTRRGGTWTNRVQSMLRTAQYAANSIFLVRKLRQMQVDVVHFQWAVLPMIDMRLVRYLAKRTPIVLTQHDIVAANGDRVSRSRTRGEGELLQAFSHIIVHTEEGARRLREKILGKGDISVIPHGQLSSQPAPSTASGPALGVDGKTVFLVFGIVKHYKGIDILIEAVKLMPLEVRRTCRFVIAGALAIDGSELERLATDGGVADLFDFRFRHVKDEEIDGLFNASDVLVFPYREIQASGAFMMSLQYGRAIIASDVGIFADMITSGRSGLLVPPSDPAALARALTQLANHRAMREAMGESARKLSLSIPSWKDIAARTADLYAGLIARRPG